MKKLFSLFLIAAMFASIIVMPSAAQEIGFSSSNVQCGTCGTTVHLSLRYEARMVDKACPNSSVPHWHDDFFMIWSGTCTGCGRYYYSEYLYESQCMAY